MEKAEDLNLCIHDLIKKFATEHCRIIFNGNGYSQEWVEEAARRGLPNITNMVDAIPYLKDEKSIALFERFGVFTRAELESRVEIKYETYSKVINIEARSMIDIATKQIIPAVVKYTTVLANSINAVRQASDADVSVQVDLLNQTSSLLRESKTALEELKKLTEEAAAMEAGQEQAQFYNRKVMKAMEALRRPVDELEMLVDKDMWPMPSYGDLLFEV